MLRSRRTSPRKSRNGARSSRSLARRSTEARIEHEIAPASTLPDWHAHAAHALDFDGDAIAVDDRSHARRCSGRDDVTGTERRRRRSERDHVRDVDDEITGARVLMRLIVDPK